MKRIKGDTMIRKIKFSVKFNKNEDQLEVSIGGKEVSSALLSRILTNTDDEDNMYGVFETQERRITFSCLGTQRVFVFGSLFPSWAASGIAKVIADRVAHVRAWTDQVLKISAGEADNSNKQIIDIEVEI